MPKLLLALLVMASVWLGSGAVHPALRLAEECRLQLPSQDAHLKVEDQACFEDLNQAGLFSLKAIPGFVLQKQLPTLVGAEYNVD